MANNVPNTLDESIKETLLRDLRQIGDKMKYICTPKASTQSCAKLREWDLWGPLFLCIFLSVLLWIKADNEQKKLLFSLLLSFIWLGSIIISLNASLLGGRISFFQSLCVLGYCLVPLDLASVICSFVPRQASFLNLLFLSLATFWSAKVSGAYVASVVPEKKQGVAVYPVWLFYFTLAWLVFLV